MIALSGAQRRAKGDFDRMRMGAWLTGLLTGAAMAGGEYPSLDAVLGNDEKPKTDLPDTAAEASANARSWGAVLRGMNWKTGGQKSAGSEEA